MKILDRIKNLVQGLGRTKKTSGQVNMIGRSSFELEGRELLSAAVVPASLKPSVHVANQRVNQAQSATPRRWQWLVDTYWNVPNFHAIHWGNRQDSRSNGLSHLRLQKWLFLGRNGGSVWWIRSVECGFDWIRHA